VLGTFVATFLYCLLVLRTVRGTQEGDFVPYLSVTSGVALAAASIGVLIYFIHHISDSIQVENLVAVVGAELKQDIARLYPPHPGERADDRLAETPSPPASTVRTKTSGYVQAIDSDGLVVAAEDGDLLVQALRRPGDFVSCGDALLLAWAGRDGLRQDQAARLCEAFSVGPRRTPTQDVRFGVRQLTEIASRALSPGINDPFTAMGCTDWLVDALADAARQTPAPGRRHGANGALRLLHQPVTFAELAQLSIEPIRAYGVDSVMVVSHLLYALARLAAQVERTPARAVVLVQAELTAVAVRRALSNDHDLQRVEDGLDRVRTAVAAGNDGGERRRPSAE